MRFNPSFVQFAPVSPCHPAVSQKGMKPEESSSPLDSYKEAQLEPGPTTRPMQFLIQIPQTPMPPFKSSKKHLNEPLVHLTGLRRLKRMSVLHMKAGDTVEEYTTAFEALAAHTGYNEAVHIEAYCSGLLIHIVKK